MKREELCKEIRDCFDLYRLQIQSSTRQNMYDINIYSENMFLNLLNLVYDWKLVNLNVEKQNEPGVDLADFDKKILVQISSTCTKEKIQSSIRKTCKVKYSGFHFFFLSISADAPELRKLSYECPGEFSFDPKRDILDLDILMKQIGASDIKKLLDIHEMITKELNLYDSKAYPAAWFRERVIENVKNIGERYSEELDVELEMNDVVSSIEHSSEFMNRFQREFEAVKVLWESIEPKAEQRNSIYTDIEGILNTMQELVGGVVNGTGQEDIDDKIKRCKELCAKMKSLVEQPDFFRQWNSFLLLRGLKEYQAFLNSRLVEVFLKKNAFIIGGAGTGKSHFMASHALRRANENKVSLLLLGQLFHDRSHPDLQIKKQLGLPENEDINEVYEAMDRWGKLNKENAVLFLDALNEGAGTDLWDDYLYGMIDRLQNYSHISLVLSIRDTYCDGDMLKQITEKYNFATLKFTGFTDVEEATAKFFAYYKVPYTINAGVMAQFRNPLFLKMYCKGYTEENKDAYGLEAVLKQYFDKTDKMIRKKYHGIMFPEKKNIVMTVLDSFIDCCIEKRGDVHYDDVYKRMDEKLGKYHISFNMLDELIGENLLQCVTYDEEKCIYLAYEVFENYLIAKRIVDESRKNVEDCEILVSRIFSRDNRYRKLIKGDNGVLEALAVILPDLDMALTSDACEVYHWPPNYDEGECLSYDAYAEAYFQSMLWRKPERIKKIAHSYVINNCFVHITGKPGVFDDFFEMVLQTAVVKKHIYNADFLYDFLMSFSLSAFNRYWTCYVSHDFHENRIFRTLLHWAWNCEKNGLVQDRSTLQALADVIVWFLASLNHNVRDITIKSLMRIYRGNHDIIVRHLQRFRFAKDKYIVEGITAAVYGAMLNSSSTDAFCEIGEILYYDYAEIPVDSILVRSYVENIFSFLAFQKIESGRVKFDEITVVTSDYDTVDQADIERIRSRAILDDDCVQELELWGISCDEWEEQALYERNRLIRNLEKDVKYIEIARSEQAYYDTEEIIEQIPHADRVDFIRMVIKEVFDAGYNELAFMDRDMQDDETDEDTITYKYVWIALNKVLDIYLARKKRLTGFYTKTEMIFQGIWQFPFFRWIDPTMDFFSSFDGREENAANIVYRLSEVKENPESIFFSMEAEEKWIFLNQIKYYDGEHQIRTATGYLAGDEKLRLLQNRFKGTDSDPFEYCFEDLYIRELYWSPAYWYIQEEERKRSGLPDGIERVSEKYIWDINDGSMKEFVSFDVVSRYLIQKMDLEMKAGRLDLYKNGTLAVKSRYETTREDVLCMREKYLSDFLKKEGKCIMWSFYESKRNLVSIIYDGVKFEVR